MAKHGNRRLTNPPESADDPPTRSPTAVTKRPVRRTLCAVIVAASVWLSYDGRIDGNPALFHEGERLACMDAIANGGMPFRDYYVQHGLSENVVKSWLACRWFGPSLESARRMGMNTRSHRGYLSAAGTAAFAICAIVLLRDARLAAAACALALLSFTETIDRHMFGFLGLACAGAFIQSRRASWLVGAGAAASLALLYSLEVGLYLGATLILWIAMKAFFDEGPRVTRVAAARRQVLAVAAGVLIPALPFAAWCAGRGILGDFGNNCYAQLALRHELFGLPWPVPQWTEAASVWANLLRAFRIIFLFHVPPLIYLTGIAFLILRRHVLRPDVRSILGLLLAFGACFWASVLGRTDEWHVAYAAGPLLLVCVMILAQARTLWPRPVIRLIPMIAIVGVLANLVWVGEGGAAGLRLFGHECSLIPDVLHTQGKTLVPCDVPRMGGVKVEPDWARFLHDVVVYVQSNVAPDETMLDLSYSGLLYFLCERQAPTRFYTQVNVGESRLRDEMVHEILSRDRLPRLVLVHVREGPPAGPLGDLVRGYYRPAQTIAHLQFWRCENLTTHRHP